MRTIVLSHSTEDGLSDTWSENTEETSPRAISSYVARHFPETKWRISRLHRKHLRGASTYAELIFMDRRDPPGTICCNYSKGYLYVELV